MNDEILNKIIHTSLNLTDATSDLLDTYHDILEYAWHDIEGVTEIIYDELIQNQITIKVEDDKIQDLKEKIKNNGWTVHQGKNQYNNRLTIRWGNLI